MTAPRPLDPHPILIVHSNGEVELRGSESEQETAVGKALKAYAFGLGLIRQTETESA